MRAGEGTECVRKGLQGMMRSVEGRRGNRTRWASFVSGIVARRKRARHMGWEFMWKTGVAEEGVVGKVFMWRVGVAGEDVRGVELTRDARRARDMCAPEAI